MTMFRSTILMLIWIVASASSWAQDLPVLALDDYASSQDIRPFLLRASDFDEPIRRDTVLSNLDSFEPITESSLRVASERGHSVFLLQVENPTDTYREWVFTTRRHSINELTIYDLTDTDPLILADSRDRRSNALNIRRYIGYGAPLSLEPGERRLLAVYADLEIMRAMPFEIYAVAPYLDEYYWQTTRYSFLLPSIFILILINLLFFAFLGRTYFLYLAASELSYLLVVVHAANYLDAFGMAAFPIVSIQISELAKCTFVVFMALFAIRFLDTRQHHPLLDRGLKLLIAIGCFLIAFWLCAGLLEKDIRVSVRYLTWIYATGGSLLFPMIGVLSVLRHGNHYIPLAIGWSAVAMVGLYILAYVIFYPLLGLPRIVTILSIIGLQEAFFVTLSAVWKTWKDQAEQQHTVEAYASELEERLKAISHAKRLEEQNALARSTIQDQNAMLQSSGHDTRQVLLAINAATAYLEQGSPNKDTELVDTLKASAAYLDDILSTTLSAKRTYSTNRTCLALSAFSIDGLFRSLNGVYRPAIGRKNLSLDMQVATDLQLISDRALLMRALSNFVANALEATTQGGIACTAERIDDRLCIDIHDSGCGIDTNLLAFLMSDGAVEQTFALARDRTMSGFRIARSIIQQLHGVLEVETEIGKGTRIRISLPCVCAHLTPTSMAEFETTVSVSLADLDSEELALDELAPRTIGVSFDDSSHMRDRAAKHVAVLLYKPIYAEMASHPAIQALK